MSNILGKYAAQTYALMRIVAGFLFLWHGTQKLFGFPPSPMQPPPVILYVGGGVELFGGLLVLLGLFTPWAAFICSGEMAFAYWYAHGTHAALPLMNGGELAALNCFVFLCISAHGAGIWSVDAARKGA